MFNLFESPEIYLTPPVQVIKEVLEERYAQDAKWGQQNHNVCEWMTILGEEFGEACQEALRIRFDADQTLKQKGSQNLRTELIQCAAVAVACVECLDRVENENP